MYLGTQIGMLVDGFVAALLDLVFSFLAELFGSLADAFGSVVDDLRY